MGVDAGQNLLQLAVRVSGRLSAEPEARGRQRGGASQECAACHHAFPEIIIGAAVAGFIEFF